MNLQKLALSLTNNGYTAEVKNDHTLTINGKEVKIIGHLCVTAGHECAFGGPSDLLKQLWAVGIINSSIDAVTIAETYLNN